MNLLLKHINKIAKFLFLRLEVYAISKITFKVYYKNKNSERVHQKGQINKKTLIYMADGRKNHGGLSDRLRGIASVYLLARDLDVDFKIHFTSPVNLLNYLLPNEYDWRIDEKDIIYSTKHSAIYQFKSYRDKNNRMNTMKCLLKHYHQIHLSSTDILADREYGSIFDYLFKPVDVLQSKLEHHITQLGGKGKYISITLRFLSLLGDFKDYNDVTLPENEQNILVSRCLEHILEIYNENESINDKVLVCSDSIKFLNAAKNKYNFVYIIPGDIAHIDFMPGQNVDIYMKSFIDYLMIANSCKVYLIVEKGMYESGFAYRASLHLSPYYVKWYK